MKGAAPLSLGNAEFGGAFEHFIINEVRAFNSYSRQDKTLSYWRTRSEEVDLIVGHEFAVEIKSSTQMKDDYFSGLEKLREENLVKQLFIVSRCTQEGTRNGIRYLYYENFLKLLWAGEILE